MLLRAFGPTEAAGPAIQVHLDAVAVTRQLSWTERIFGRCSRDSLRGDLATQCDEQAHHIQVTAARGLALERCLRIVDSAAEALNIRYSLVKVAMGTLCPQ